MQVDLTIHGVVNVSWVKRIEESGPLVLEVKTLDGETNRIAFHKVRPQPDVIPSENSAA